MLVLIIGQQCSVSSFDNINEYNSYSPNCLSALFVNVVIDKIIYFRVYEELGSSPQTDEATYEDRLQSVVVSPHRAHKHRRDSSPEERKLSKVGLNTLINM